MRSTLKNALKITTDFDITETFKPVSPGLIVKMQTSLRQFFQVGFFFLVQTHAQKVHRIISIIYIKGDTKNKMAVAQVSSPGGLHMAIVTLFMSVI